jgi:hypothetical protein
MTRLSARLAPASAVALTCLLGAGCSSSERDGGIGASGSVSQAGMSDSGGKSNTGGVGASTGGTADSCLEPGTDCAQGTCCGGASCVPAGDQLTRVCAAECKNGSECNSGCCASIDGGPKVCGPASNCETACVAAGEECSTESCCAGPSCVSLCGGGHRCGAVCKSDSDCKEHCCLDGACQPSWACGGAKCRGAICQGCSSVILVGDDATFLGNARASQVAADGVCNQVSPFGSPVGANSIFNQVGTYGSSVSSLSAYNTIASTPPALLCEETGEILARVSKNGMVAGAVDPDKLCAVLEASGCL